MPEADVQAVLGEAFRRINELGRRLRALEERYELSEARAASLQEGIIKNSEADRERAGQMSAQLKVMEERLAAISNDIAKLGKLMEKSAKRSEVEELRSTIELWEPFGKKPHEKGE